MSRHPPPLFALSLSLVALLAGAVVEGEPVIGVDTHGNLHINTTLSNTTVYINGRAFEESLVGALESEVSSLQSEVAQLRCSARRFSPQKVITTSADGARSVFAADLDGDGDMDVLSASQTDNTIAWYENLFGNGTFSQLKVISTSANGAESVHAADVDGDGDMDVLSASRGDSKIAWYENTDGKGTFSAQKVITTNTRVAVAVHAADIDGDGDVDVLSASTSDDKITWFENFEGDGSVWQETPITISADGATAVFAADLDGDEDLDVLSASSSDSKIAWYENMDEGGTFSQVQAITVGALGAQSVFAADLNGDGDVDVLSASSTDSKIAWYRNEDGLGTFSVRKVITASAAGAQAVFAADLDGDGDMDVLSASEHDDKVAWYENADGVGSFLQQRLITTSAALVQSVFAADLDGDGDMDVLSASWHDDKIAWYENLC